MKWSTAPVGNTCPDIDDAISNIGSLADMAQACEDYDPSHYKEAIKILEQLRGANDRLRQWGDGLQEEVNGYEKEVEYLKSQNENYKEDARDWEQKYYDLEKEQAELTNNHE